MNLEEISEIALIGLQDELGTERKQEDDKKKKKKNHAWICESGPLLLLPLAQFS